MGRGTRDFDYMITRRHTTGHLAPEESGVDAQEYASD